METALDAGKLLDLALEISRSLDPHTVMTRLLEHSIEFAACDRATLSSISGDELRIEASVGAGGDVQWIGRRYDRSYLARQVLVQEMLDTKAPVIGGPMDLSTAAAEFATELAKVRHSAVLPIIDGDEITGMVALSRFEDPPFLETDRPAMSAIGALAGLALRNAHAHQRMRDAERRARAAVAAATEIGATTGVDDQMAGIIGAAATAADADVTALMTLEASDWTLRATSGIAQVGARWPIPADIVAALTASGTIQVAPSDLELESIGEDTAAFSHVLLSALRIRGETLGILVAARVADRSAFSPADIASIQQFGALAALLMRNARLLDDVREADGRKREFLDFFVHELKSPLTVIAGYGDILATTRDASPDDVARIAAIVVRKSSEAIALASDVLTLARVESGDLIPAISNVRVAEVIEAACERAAARAALLDGAITWTADATLNAAADPVLLGRILDTLVGNALIYVQGAPDVTITATRGPGHVIISVADNGVGVPINEREAIFDRYMRGTRAVGRPGTGIGLYVSRECARLMHGDVRFGGEQRGSGSIFDVHIPDAQNAESDVSR